MWRRLTAGLFLTGLWLGSADWMIPYFHGSTSGTTTLGFIPLTDPLAGLELLIATRSWHATALIGAIFLVGFAAVVGPVFCAWVCPLGLLLDLNSALRRLVRRRLLGARRTEPVSDHPPGWFKFALLGFLAGFVAVMRFPLFQILSPINLFARALIFGSTFGLTLVAAIAVLEWGWPRMWCRSLCPLGALYGLVGRCGLLRVQIDPAKAGKTPCRRCSAQCPMGVPVMDEFTMKKRRSVIHHNCTRCGECTQVCPRGVLKLSFRPFAPGPFPSVRPDQPESICDCSNVSLPIISVPSHG
ncbi:MAG: quinol dehydrogenase ferredoxin subunit NapH [Phycisphaerales bacterium]